MCRAIIEYIVLFKCLLGRQTSRVLISPHSLIFESAVFAGLLFGQIFEGAGIVVLESHEIYISNNKVKLYVSIS